MFDYNKIKNDFNLDIETSKDILDAIQEWSDIYNGKEPWVNKSEGIMSLHVAKSICEKVAKAVTIEYKSKCSDKYIDSVYQKILN